MLAMLNFETTEQTENFNKYGTVNPYQLAYFQALNGDIK